MTYKYVQVLFEIYKSLSIIIKKQCLGCILTWESFVNWAPGLNIQWKLHCSDLLANTTVCNLNYHSTQIMKLSRGHYNCLTPNYVQFGNKSYWYCLKNNVFRTHTCTYWQQLLLSKVLTFFYLLFHWESRERITKCTYLNIQLLIFWIMDHEAEWFFPHRAIRILNGLKQQKQLLSNVMTIYLHYTTTHLIENTLRAHACTKSCSLSHNYCMSCFHTDSIWWHFSKEWKTHFHVPIKLWKYLHLFWFS